MPLFALLLSSLAFAGGAEEYGSLSALAQKPLYNLTCSSSGKGEEVHVAAAVENGRVTDFKIVLVSPARSLRVIAFSPAEAQGLGLSLTGGSLSIEGNRPGAYYDEEVSLHVRAQGLTADFSYDDRDGLQLDRALKCGAANYQ